MQSPITHDHPHALGCALVGATTDAFATLVFFHGGVGGGAVSVPASICASDRCFTLMSSRNASARLENMTSAVEEESVEELIVAVT